MNAERDKTKIPIETKTQATANVVTGAKNNIYILKVRKNYLEIQEKEQETDHNCVFHKLCANDYSINTQL